MSTTLNRHIAMTGTLTPMDYYCIRVMDLHQIVMEHDTEIGRANMHAIGLARTIDIQTHAVTEATTRMTELEGKLTDANRRLRDAFESGFDAGIKYQCDQFDENQSLHLIPAWEAYAARNTPKSGD